MDKGIGFRRNIYLDWLNATAAFCIETSDPKEIRERLEPIVSQTVTYRENLRVAIDILLNIWFKTREIAPRLRDDALEMYQLGGPRERVWLHYGLTLLYYPFFRDCVAAIGQLSRFEDEITSGMVKQRLVAERGALGALEKAVERVVFSLRDWGMLGPGAKRNAYAPRRYALAIEDAQLEAWLLACALHAYPGEELVSTDLVRLPELFPFRLHSGVDDLREHSYFTVQRQGAGWDMVRLALDAAAHCGARVEEASRPRPLPVAVG